MFIHVNQKFQEDYLTAHTFTRQGAHRWKNKLGAEMQSVQNAVSELLSFI